MKTVDTLNIKYNIIAGVSLIAISLSGNVQAADDDEIVFLEEIVVTAMKKSAATNVQDVPTAVTAFGKTQLENKHVISLGDLGYDSPNVTLDDVGTFPGYANFSIRGLGINSSVPSIDPTVGVFVDGMYLGISAGVLFDTFDVESVEILRGPQGLLFGRNVTGGAIVLNTTVPGDEFQASGRVAIESGTKYIASGSVSGPVIEDRLNAKIAAFYSKDNGWFENVQTGEAHGKSETTIIRPALNFTPSENLQFILKLEAGWMNGDGPAAQNRDIPTLGKFEIQIDEPGYSDAEWLSAVSETNIDVSFGDGVITNVFAWRNYKAGTLSDIDASPIIGFHAETYIDQEQFSNELRYAGTFGDLEITAGAYYFTQDINYVEDRLVAGGAVNLTGGGDQTYETLGLFSSADWNFAEEWTLNLGIRYTHEEKEAALADLVSGGCNLETLTCSVTFDEKNDWSAVTPKVGIRWAPDSDTLAYAFWTRGFRSGGYNFRNGPTTIPGPFDQEKQNSYELGLKKDFDNSTRVNVAAFYNEIQNLQREILFVGENNVTFQTIANAADAEIWGLEFEAQTYISSNFSLAANFGYIHDAYTNVFFDLNKDGQVNAADKDLHLPRVAPWSYGISGTYTQDIDGVGALRANLGFSHRDRQFYDDNNQGVLSPADMVNASISIASDDANWKFSIYGRNLLNDLTEGLNTSVPIFSPGSTFTTLNKGRVLGAELTFKY